VSSSSGSFIASGRKVVSTATDLTEDEARWTPERRLLPIIGVINHLTHVEWRWIEGRYLNVEFPKRTEEFVVGHDLSLAEVIAAYWERESRTEQLVRAAPSLQVACLGREGQGPPAHILLGVAEPVDLRWVVVHLIEETAHHAGHADSTREMLDGKKMRAQLTFRSDRHNVDFPDTGDTSQNDIPNSRSRPPPIA
jgi:hypothetical protein